MDSSLKTEPHWMRMLVFIMLGGTVLRVIAAVSNGTFWFDEIITASIAQKPLALMWQYLRVENHPPLHYFIIHAWMVLFGTGEAAVKLSSVFAGALGIGVTGIFARRLFGAHAGLVAAGVAALSTFQIFFSAEARMYPWLYLFGLISLLSFWELFAPAPRRTWYWIWGCSTLAALYTHLGGVFTLFIEAGFALFLRARVWFRAHQGGEEGGAWPYLPLKRVFLITGLQVLLWLPWLVVFVREKMQTFNRNAWYFWIEPANPFPMEALRQFFFFDNVSDFLELCGWIFVLIILITTLLQLRREGRGCLVRFDIDAPTAYATITFIVPIVAGILANVSVMKVYIIAGAGLYALAGKGLSRLRIPAPIPSFLLPLLLTVFFFASAMGVLFEVRPAWKEVGAYLAAREDQTDAIVIISHSYEVALRYYYKGTTPVVPFYPLPDDTHGDSLLRAVRRNWYTLITKDNVDTLGSLVEGKKKIFVVLVGNFNKVERIAPEWFFSHGWQLRSIKRWEDYMVNPEVMLLEKYSVK
ncbi:MAG: glycosyltransferase family 39 protein [Patescibacteria group bacterium]